MPVPVPVLDVYQTLHLTGFLLDQELPAVVHNPNPKKDQEMPVQVQVQVQVPVQVPEKRGTKDSEVYTFRSLAYHPKELVPENHLRLQNTG